VNQEKCRKAFFSFLRRICIFDVVSISDYYTNIYWYKDMEFNCCAENSSEAADIEETYRFLRAVADSNRLKILCILRDGPKCVCEIAPAAGISDKLASHHLRQLKTLGILNERREGTFAWYGLERGVIREYKKLLSRVIR